MESYNTEEEQLEALKRWWDENGRSTITAIIVALALGFGWQGWQKYQVDQAESASNAYQSMLQQFSLQNVEAAQALAQTLKTDYAGTTYAQFAALHLARIAVEADDLPAAEEQLRWVVEQADKGSETATIAQLRLARVVSSSGDPAGALAILDAANPGSFQAAYQAARGDILMQQGNRDGAKEAYSSALMLAARGGESLNTALLQEKLQSLSPQPPQQVSSNPQPVEAVLPAAADDAGETNLVDTTEPNTEEN